MKYQFSYAQYLNIGIDTWEILLPRPALWYDWLELRQRVDLSHKGSQILEVENRNLMTHWARIALENRNGRKALGTGGACSCSHDVLESPLVLEPV